MINKLEEKSEEVEIRFTPEGWNRFSFGKVADFNPKRDLKKGKSSKFVAMTDIQTFTKKVSSYSYKDFNGGSKFKNGDTIMARITPCLENGKTSYIDFLEDGEVAGGSTEFIVLNGIDKISDPDFIYYLAISPLVRNSAIKAMTGTSGRQRVENDKLANSFILLPPLNEQQKIAEILSSLDDKIELNRKINNNLEKIASSLFKRWFVDFEFPDKDGKPYKSSGGKMIDSELGEIPDEWRIENLGHFFPVITGKKDANIAGKSGKYPFFSCSQDILYTNEYSFDSSSLLLAGNGDFNIKLYEGKFEAYQRTYVLTPYKKELIGFLLFLISNFLDEITAGHRGSVIKFITKGMIEDFKISVPSDNELIKMADIFYEISKSIDFYKKENDNLSQIRDSLLPRLMNGKIRV